ncbi:unnamed protein product, partial [Porites evermanni]
MFFGWRARDENHRVKYGDIKIKCEDGPEGREYAEWIIERGSKTRTGEHEFGPDRTFNPKMFATDGPRCPVKILKEYLARRPPEMATTGKNSLGSFMKSMREAAGLSEKHTNHSVRRTMISTLRKQNVEPLNIIALAGQRNLKSLDSYSSTSTKQQKDMSLKLSCYVEGEERHKSVAKSQVMTPKQRGENGGNNLFSGAVFNYCNFTFTPAEAGFSCDNA